MTPHTSIFDANSALNLGASDALPFLTGMDALMETDSTGFVLAPIAHFDSPLGENLFLGETLAFSPVEDDLAASVSGDLVGSSQTLLPTSAGDSLTHSDSDHSNPVAAAVAQVQQSLQSWRNSSNFASGVRTVYGNGVNVAQAAVELDNLLSASGAISKLQVVDSLGSAEGAYAAANDTIYLSEKFVSNPNQTVDDITRVIIEELGHALDVRLNEADTAGDEGALFAAEVMGEKLSATERAAIAVEDDSATVVIDDQELAIEQSASNMDALILISGERRLADDNAAVQARLEQLGFTVSVKQVTGTTVYNQNGSVDYFSSFDRSDTDGMELIVATGFTSPPKTEIDGLEIPVLLTSQASLDEFDMVAEPTGLSGSNFSRYFELHEHPITTGVSLEDISLYKNSVHEPVGFSLPAASAKSILTVDLSGFGQPEYSSIFAYEQGDRLFNGQIAAARRVSFLGLHDGIVNLSDFGWQLFDNSVNWAVGASTDTSGGSSFGITFALSNDTGDDDSDRITSDPTIAGQLNDTAGLTTFEARLGNSGEYLDILHELQPDGSFVLDLADLETLNGGLLGSGDYTLQVRAGNASEVSDPASFDFTYEPDTEAMGLSQETINLALSEFGFDLATVNFSTIVLEDETVIVRTEDNRDIILPRYGRASFGGGGSFGGFGGGYGGGGSGFRPWVAFNYNRPSSSGGSSNPGDPTPPPEEGIYIQSIDGNGFRVIYDRVDLAGDAFVHKPKTIETAFGNINFFYHDQANSTQGIAKGDFSYTDDPEVFEVLLAAVGAQSVDDLSDIFVTGPFTQSEALAKEEAERVKTISDLWTRMGYIGISPNLGIQDLNLTTEERKQLLDFQENLLKATALTDEFARFGREEDALLLGEMTQLARVYAALDPQLEENIGGSSGGSSSPPPVEDIDVLLVSQYRLTPGEQLMVDRLSADGFNVTSKWSGHFQKSDVEDQELVIITGNIFSSDSVLDDLAVPIISLQTIMLDELDIRPVGSNGGNSAVSGRGDTITISSPDHPLAGGFSGDVEIFNPDSNGSVHILRPTEDAVEIATFSSSSGMESSPILGYEKGANLLNGEIAPERRVAFIPYFQFEKFNENGWQLFDAAVDWAAGLEEEEKDPKQFQSTTVLDFFANTIWKAGNLEQSTINEFKEEFTDFSEVAIDSTIGVDYLGKLFFVLNETDATKETIQNNFAINEFFVEGTSFTSSVIRGKEAEVNGDELFLEILKAGSDSELSQIAEDINTLINNSLLLASEDNFLSNFHQQINDLSDTIEIPDDAVDWNLLGLVRWQLGIDEINDFKNEWIYDYRNAINTAAAVFDIPNILIAGIAHIEVGGGLGAEDSLVYNVRRIPGTGNIPGQVGYPPTTTSFGNMSIQIATAASTLRYYGDPEDLEPEVKASIIDSLIDPVENILIAAAHLSDIRNIYFPEKDGFELSERDLMTIAGAYNAGTSYTIDELWEFGFAGGYGRAAVQDRVSEHNLEQLLRGER